jgi:adenylate kinase
VKRLSTRKICHDCGNSVIDIEGTAEKCPKCGGSLIIRSDDKKEVVRSRIANYLPLITELKSYYQSRGELIEIDGQGTIEDIHQTILRALNEK